VLGLMMVAARLFPIHLSAANKVLVDAGVMFAAILLLPAPLAIAVVVSGFAVAEGIMAIRSPQQPLRYRAGQFVFNCSETAIEAAAGAMVYYLLQPDGFGSGSTATVDLAAIALSALTIYLLNVVLVDIVIALTIGFASPAWSINRHRTYLPQQFALYFLGLFAALTAFHYPLTLAFLFIPSAIVYISMRDSQHLRDGAQRTMESLADIVDLRDRYTFEHSTRVANFARGIAIELRLAPEEIDAVYLAARVHDVGKIGVKGQVLLKEGPLSDNEWIEMRTHPEVGAQLVSHFPDYTSAASYIVAHHERYDGRGYPRKLKGDDIPIGARIISVADCFDAMTSNRPYRDALEVAQSVAEIRRNSARQFDPQCVEALMRVLVKDGLIPGEGVASPRLSMTPELAG
jgi:HD-GYP domain-containing protein (c-di-GMP phosphodiesterase class II)